MSTSVIEPEIESEPVRKLTCKESMRLMVKVMFCGQHFPFSFQHVQTELKNRQIPESQISCERIEMSSGYNHLANEILVAIPLMEQLSATWISELNKVNNLNSVIQFGAGLELVDIPYCTSKGIYVQNIPSDLTGNADATAEHAVYLLLSALRQPRKAQSFFEKGILGGPVTQQILGKNVVLFGFGGVGKKILKRLVAYEAAKISIVKRSELTKEEQNLVHSCVMFSEGKTTVEVITEANYSNFDTKKELLSEADIILLSCVVNNETRGMVDEAFLNILKTNSVIVNVARGQLVKRAPILNALENGKLGFYATDVGCLREGQPKCEPFPVDDILVKHEKTIFTPHNGGVADVSYKNMARILVDNLVNIYNFGKPLGNVNKL